MYIITKNKNGSRVTYTEEENDLRSVTIISTGHHTRVFYGWELTKKERKEMDFVSDEDLPETRFFRYGGIIYHLSDVAMSGHPDGWQFGTNRTRNRAEEDKTNPWYDWDVVCSDSFFSGIVLKWVPEDNQISDDEEIILGRYY